MTKENMTVRAESCKLFSYVGSIDSGEYERILFPEFKSVSENVRVVFEYKLTFGNADLVLFGKNMSEEKIIYRKDVLANDGVISYEFDPVNLAVYRDMQSFLFAIVPNEKTKIEISTFYAEEVAFADIIENTKEEQKKKYPVPNKMLFIGNSLLLGMENTFGMCSTARDKDYFHHVSSYVKSMNPECAFLKLHGSSYEHSTTLAESLDWFTNENLYTKRPAEESFTPDVDIVMLQMGDNINTEEKFEAFRAGKDAFIEKIKTLCPKARLIWVHGWYNREPVYTYIVELCEKWGIERVYVRDIRSNETEAHGKTEYLSKDGTFKPIKETWITHPGDLGMKMIAERIIETLSLE